MTPSRLGSPSAANITVVVNSLPSSKDVIAVAVFGLRLAKPILAVIILDSFVGLPLDVAGNAFLAEILVGAAVLYGLWALVGKP